MVPNYEPKNQVRCVASVESSLSGRLHAAILEDIANVREVLPKVGKIMVPAWVPYHGDPPKPVSLTTLPAAWWI